MGRIFISHSSANNAAALAVAQFLANSGCADYFLDVSPERGLFPGDRWQQALRMAADRCEAILFLISPAWSRSRWCLAEFLLAKQLGKKVFGVLVEATEFDQLPPEMTLEWQLCDLVVGADRQNFQVGLDPVVAPTDISFARAGLDRLRMGLQKAGLNAETFPWPPPHDPARSPYRGLRALEPDDAAVFFGRDADLVRGLDALRRVREQGIERMMVILGASGAGKSSFLRAGLWARLMRDEGTFLPIPVMRPEQAAITGPSGLAACLERAFIARGGSRTRASIGKVLQHEDGLDRLLGELLVVGEPWPTASSPLPTVVIGIDQAEEMFRPEGRGEADELLAGLAYTLGRPRTRAITVVTIRSDSYERFQVDALLAGVSPCLFSLAPIDRAEFKSVIEGPAGRATAAGRRLQIEPGLMAQLLNDAHGPDALPLLAFTLERLFLEHGADGDLKLDEYWELGGVRGCIDLAVRAAFEDPGRKPPISADAAQRHRDLHRGFVPWLARVDPDTGTRVRRVSRWDEIPESSRPVLERLVDTRLLIKDRRRVAETEGDADVVEIAHEALLRQWDALASWLDEDGDALRAAEVVRRASIEWKAHQGRDDWLVHGGERLEVAGRLLKRDDLQGLVGDDGREYVRECRAIETRRRRAVRRRATLIAVLSVLALTAALVASWAWRNAVRQTTAALHGAAAIEFLRGASSAQEPEPRGQYEALPRLANVLRLNPGHAGARTLLRSSLFTRSVMLQLSHTGAAMYAAFSPDGSLVVTASDDGTARIWSASSGLSVGPPLQHADVVYYAEFDGVGQRVVTASWDGSAQVWDARSGAAIGPSFRHSGVVYSARFSPDGTRVVTASGDGSARVWDVSTGRAVGDRLAHNEAVHAAMFHPGGHLVLTASRDHTARIWSVSTSREVGGPLRHDDQVYAARFSEDGTRVVTASMDRTARVWSVVSGQQLTPTPFTHEGPVFDAAFSPDGKRVVTASLDATARVWSVEAGASVGSLMKHGGGVYKGTFSPDGTQVLTASLDGSALIWDATTGDLLAQPLIHRDAVNSAVFSNDGTRVVTASVDTTARIWQVPAPPLLGIPLPHDGWVTSASFSHDGARVVTSSFDKDAWIWDVRTGRRVSPPLRHDDWVYGARFSPDGSRVSTVSKDRTARLWDTTSGTRIGAPMHHGDVVSAVDFAHDGTRVVTASADGSAKVWDASTGVLIGRPLEHGGAVNSAVFSPDGALVVTASADGSARVWHSVTGEPLSPPLNHGGAVNTATFDAGGRWIVTASNDKTARVWDTQSGVPIAKPLRHVAAVTSAAFSPDGRRLATASSDGSARIWDPVDGIVLGQPLQHAAAVQSVAFSRDGTRVVTASKDGTARVWDVFTGMAISPPLRHAGAVLSASFSPDGNFVLTASADNSAKVWELVAGTQGDAPILAELAEATGGWSADARGELRLLRDQPTRLQSLREKVAHALPGDASAASFARWLLADPWTRSLTPLSSVTADEYICGRLRRQEYREAHHAFPGHPLLRGGEHGTLPSVCSQPQSSSRRGR